MARCSMQPRTRMYVKEYGFFSFGKVCQTNTKNRYWILLQKARLDALKPWIKKVAHKVAQVTGEFIANNIAEKLLKTPKPVPGETSRNIEEIFISPEKKRRIMEYVKASIIRWNIIRYLRY